MKKTLLIFITTISIFILTGCYDYIDVNDRLFVGGVAFDKKDNEYIVSVQILYAQRGAADVATGQAQPTVYEGKGKTISLALADIANVAPKTLSLTHVQLLVIQEQIAKEGIKDILDYFLRHYESRNQFDIIISKEKTASEILKIYTAIESFPAFNIVGSLQNSMTIHGISNALLYDELISYILKEGIEPTLPGISIIGDAKEGGNQENIKNLSPKAQLRIEPLGVFKNDKLVGWLDKEESIGYNLLEGRVKTIAINFPCDDNNNYMAIRLLRTNSSVNLKVKNNRPTANITFSAEVRLSEITCDLEINKSIDYIEKLVNKEITRLIEKAIYAAQKKHNSDILGFGNKIYQSNLSYWRKNEKKWDKIFPTIDSNIKVKTTLIRRGLLDKTIYDSR